MKNDATNLRSQTGPLGRNNGEPLAGRASWVEHACGIAFAVAAMGLVSALALATY
jgi:hypothetical protein